MSEHFENDWKWKWFVLIYKVFILLTLFFSSLRWRSNSTYFQWYFCFCFFFFIFNSHFFRIEIRICSIRFELLSISRMYSTMFHFDSNSAEFAMRKLDIFLNTILNASHNRPPVNYLRSSITQKARAQNWECTKVLKRLAFQQTKCTTPKWTH